MVERKGFCNIPAAPGAGGGGGGAGGGAPPTIQNDLT